MQIKDSLLSVGNDVIDLSLVQEERTIQERFYSKIITQSELKLYKEHKGLETIPFYTFIWIAWSIKESAYKFIKRNFPEVIFSPMKMEIIKMRFSKEKELISIVKIQSHSINCRTIYTSQLVHTNTFFQEIKDTESHIFYNQENVYKNVTEYFLDFQKSNSNVNIKKNENGFPELFIDDVKQESKISFSDHGSYLSFAILRNLK